MNGAEYADYQERVKEFFEEEGIRNLSLEEDENGNSESWFSMNPCDCCGRPLGGDRFNASGWNPETKEVQKYEVCWDCIYMAEYGELEGEPMEG